MAIYMPNTVGVTGDISVIKRDILLAFLSYPPLLVDPHISV